MHQCRLELVQLRKELPGNGIVDHKEEECFGFERHLPVERRQCSKHAEADLQEGQRNFMTRASSDAAQVMPIRRRQTLTVCATDLPLTAEIFDPGQLNPPGRLLIELNS